MYSPTHKRNWMDKLADYFEEQYLISNYLSKKENWTPMLIHVHKNALGCGVILGVVMGVCLALGTLMITFH